MYGRVAISSSVTVGCDGLIRMMLGRERGPCFAGAGGGGVGMAAKAGRVDVSVSESGDDSRGGEERGRATCTGGSLEGEEWARATCTGPDSI